MGGTALEMDGTDCRVAQGVHKIVAELRGQRPPGSSGPDTRRRPCRNSRSLGRACRWSSRICTDRSCRSRPYRRRQLDESCPGCRRDAVREWGATIIASRGESALCAGCDDQARQAWTAYNTAWPNVSWTDVATGCVQRARPDICDRAMQTKFAGPSRQTVDGVIGVCLPPDTSFPSAPAHRRRYPYVVDYGSPTWQHLGEEVAECGIAVVAASGPCFFSEFVRTNAVYSRACMNV